MTPGKGCLPPPHDRERLAGDRPPRRLERGDPGAFDTSTKEPSIWVGEAGLLVAVAILAVAWALVRKGFATGRTPGAEPFATVPGLAG